MDCTRHFAMFTWQRHKWQRRVTATEREFHGDTNMWGRPIFNPHVICHAEYVCERCGAVRDDGDCICDAEKGDRCAVRVARLNELKARGAQAH
jgi:hypothetical protein